MDTPDVSAAPTAGGAQQPAAGQPVPPKVNLNSWLALLLSLVMGAVAWGVIQTFDPVFEVPKEFHIVAMGAPQEKVDALLAAKARTDCKNAAIYLGLLGGLLALGLALASGRALGAPIALPVGFLLGALDGWIGSLVHERWSLALGQDELMRTVGVQATVLGGLGLAVGLAFAAAQCRLRWLLMAGLGGIVAGVVTGTIYPVGMSIVMPAVNSEPLIPQEATCRLIWIELMACLLGLVVPLAVRGRKV
jgi:hypothetical protein